MSCVLDTHKHTYTPHSLFHLGDGVLWVKCFFILKPNKGHTSTDLFSIPPHDFPPAKFLLLRGISESCLFSRSKVFFFRCKTLQSKPAQHFLLTSIPDFASFSTADLTESLRSSDTFIFLFLTFCFLVLPVFTPWIFLNFMNYFFLTLWYLCLSFVCLVSINDSLFCESKFFFVFCFVFGLDVLRFCTLINQTEKLFTSAQRFGAGHWFVLQIWSFRGLLFWYF